MRILLVLLLLAQLLAVAAEDADPQRLREQCQATADALQRIGGELASTAIEAELPVPPALPDRLRAMYAEFMAQSAALGGAKPDTAAVQTLLLRGSDLVNGASDVVSQLRMIASSAKSFPASDRKPQRQYLDPLRATAIATMAKVAASGMNAPLSEEDGLRREQLLVAMQLLRGQLQIGPGHPHLPVAEPPASEFSTWVAAERARLDGDLAQPFAVDANERDEQMQRMTQALRLSERRLELWDGLLAASERRRAVDLPLATDAAGPGLPALRQALDRQIDQRRQCLVLLAEKPVLSSQLHEELERLMRVVYQFDDVVRAASVAIEWQRDFIQTRTTLIEQFAKCPDGVRKNLQARLDQIATDAVTFQGRQLKALVDRDRVDAVEAEGEMELVQLRLLALSEETESERGIAEGEALWRGKEKDPALRELAQRYQDQHRKLSDAHAKLLKAQLQQRQIENRLALLRLKADLSGTQVEEAAGKMQHLRDELGRLNQDLGEAAAKAGERSKDAKDAERIPLVKPGVDDF